jgi:hypothetical protein
VPTKVKFAGFISFVIFLSILFNTCGTAFLFVLIQYRLKKEIREYIAEKISLDVFERIEIPITSIDVQGDNFQFTEDDEFMFNGNMYDIVRTESTDSSKIFYCVNDDSEENLLGSLENCISNNFKGDYFKLIKFFLPDFLFTKQFNKIAFLLNTHSNDIFYQSFLLKGYLSIFEPPPKY